MSSKLNAYDTRLLPALFNEYSLLRKSYYNLSSVCGTGVGGLPKMWSSLLEQNLVLLAPNKGLDEVQLQDYRLIR